MLDFFEKDWKTTLSGIVAFVATGLVTQGYITPEMGTAISLVTTGVIGLLAKDA